MRLATHELPQIRLYEGAGFRLLGPSDVVHGKDPWYDMALEL